MELKRCQTVIEGKVCGAIAEVVTYPHDARGPDTFYVDCLNNLCGASPMVEPRFETPEEAVENWNKEQDRLEKLNAVATNPASA